MPSDKKEAIAEAARRLIMEKQVKKLTVKDIVEECQITRQAFYYHFEDIPALFRWTLKRDGEKLVDEALAFQDPEQGLKYFFQIAINVAPYIKRGIQTNYGPELRQMLFEGCYRFFEQAALRENVAEKLPNGDIRLFLRYHCHGIIGILQEWTDEDTQNLDRIAHEFCFFAQNSLTAGSQA